MTDEKESNFKVTDRRKFNADGSPRDQVAEQQTAEQEVDTTVIDAELRPIRAEAVNAPAGDAATSNVVSFPGEAATKRLEQAATSSASPPASVPAPADAPTPAAAGARDEQGAAENAFNTAAGPRASGVPEASFLNLLNMLAVEAAMHLGMIHPQGQEPLPVDLESARHLIDLLGMLQAKTRGNLTADEDGLLENILADLRMQFVAASKGQ